MSLRKVLTVGTFDTIHAGHVDLFRRCKTLGQVWVGLNTDEFIHQFKNHYPVCSYNERKDILEEIRSIHKVLPNEGGADSKPLILKVMPYYLVIGSDWLRKDYLKQMDLTVDWLEEHNITLVYIPRVRPLSSTTIRERVKRG